MKITDEVFAYESDKVTPFIYKTSNLEQFNNYEFNRDLDIGHVRLLANRIKDFTLCPLLCRYEDNGKLYILDGQHRLEVAKKKNIPLYYRIVKDVKSMDIADLQVKKNWSMLNWVKYWVYYKKEDYIKLLDLYNRHKLSISALASLLTSTSKNMSGYGLCVGGGTTKNVIAGKFVITNELFANKLLKQLQDFPTSIKKNSMFIKAMIAVNTAYESNYSHYDHNIMKKRLETYPEKFEKKANTQDYLRMIEDVMNIGAQLKDRFRFF